MFARSFCSRAGTAACRSSRSAMPLRSKITNPTFTGKAQMATSTQRGSPKEEPEVIRELPEDPKEDVLFDTLFGVRTIELNRPEKLHSLNGSMIRKIIPRLQEWAKSDMANVVIIKGSGEKAFCAGGDVAELAKSNKQGPKGQQRSTDYFGLEYKLDHLIATYQKPYIAFMDGITMGGGVGLSVHAPLRIATEKTLFAMPETTIGFFPDVGASFFLPRMPGAVGTYLALTSEKLKGVNAFYAGVATHYMHSTSLPALERRLAELRFKDYDSLTERLELINSTMEEFCTGLPYDEPILIGGILRKTIDDVFGRDSVPEILKALEEVAEGSHAGMQEWAKKTLQTLRKRSPTSIYVTLRQMKLGQRWSIADSFVREYHMASKFMRHPDFTEGVDALLIRKDGKPKWQPASLDDVKPEDNIEDRFFQVHKDDNIKLLVPSKFDYKGYPHQHLGIPREYDIQQLIEESPKSRKEVLQYFLTKRKGKQGVKEIVTEVLERKTKEENGVTIWED